MTELLVASGAERLAQPFAAARGQPQQPTASDIHLDGLLLAGWELTAELESAITGGDLERTIEGASTLTLTLSDQSRDLLRSGMFVNEKKQLIPLALTMPGPRRRLHFALAKLAKAEDEFTLTFEDREVTLLRLHSKPKKAYRDRVTRAEFVLSLIREVKRPKIRTYIPELHKNQPIKGSSSPAAKPKRKARKTSSEEERSGGLGPGEKLTIKGKQATPWQLKQAEISLNVGASLDANELAMMAMLVSGIGESSFTQIENTAGSGYAGVFQAHPRNIPRTDTEEQARCFFEGGKGFQAGGALHLAKTKPNLTPGSIATQVEASGEPPSFYDAFKSEAKAILEAFGGAGGGGGDGGTRTVSKRFAFTRGSAKKREDSWTAIQRLAEEVGWRAFMVEGTFYFISEADLFKSKPRMKISEETPGVDWIDWDWDYGKEVGECTTRCRAELWMADPGAVVVIEDEGSPVEGRWLTTSVRRGLYDEACEITLKKPMKEKPEPAPEKEQKAAGRGSGGGSGAGSSGATAQLIEECRKFSGPYSYGGGHGPAISELAPSEALDCSSSTALALHLAGLYNGQTAQVSGWFASSWGEPGEGKEFTVWANSGHVFIQFKEGGRFDTGGPGGGNGPRLRPEKRGTGGFTPRHAKGL